jgi:hypothetical protein
VGTGAKPVPFSAFAAKKDLRQAHAASGGADFRIVFAPVCAVKPGKSPAGFLKNDSRTNLRGQLDVT